MKHSLAVSLDVPTARRPSPVVLEAWVAQLRVETRTLAALHGTTVPQLQVMMNCNVFVHAQQALPAPFSREIAQMFNLVASILARLTGLSSFSASAHIRYLAYQ